MALLSPCRPWWWHLSMDVREWGAPAQEPTQAPLSHAHASAQAGLLRAAVLV